MRHRVPPAISILVGIPMLLAVAVAEACGASQTGDLQVTLAEDQASPGWGVNILEVTRPATVKIQTRSIYGGVNPETAESPPAEHGWLVLAVELTAPDTGASLLSERIEVVDESSESHPSLALSGTPTFIYFEDSDGLLSLDSEANIQWLYSRAGEDDGMTVMFPAKGPNKVLLLFAIPASARSLRLRL